MCCINKILQKKNRKYIRNKSKQGIKLNTGTFYTQRTMKIVIADLMF